MTNKELDEKFYRFIVGDQGIYEAVYTLDPERNDPRRANKPDGGWLPRVGEDFEGAISFWTKTGLQKYKKSGLMQWHIDFLQKPVEVLVGINPQEIRYMDEYQIILNPQDIVIAERVSTQDLVE